MLDQEKTGKFIAAIRKDRELTQKDLADRLGISDKTVSKWETGRGMPDVSLMPELCAALSVSINELLAGERLDNSDTFNQKAEENIMELMHESKKASTNWRWTVGGGLIGLLLLLLFTISLNGLHSGDYINYLDLPSIFCVAGITLLVLTAAGALRAFGRGILLCFRKSPIDAAPSKELLVEKQTSADAITLAIRSNLLAGGFGFVTGIVTMMTRLDDPAQIGPNIAVALLTVFYAILFDLFLLPIRERLKSDAPLRADGT